jgi:hypothetical protein
MMILKFWLLSILTSDGTPVIVGDPGQWIIATYVLSGCVYLFRGTNHVHLGISKFDLPGVHIVDQLVAVHKIDADNVVVQFGDHIHRMGEFLSFDPEVHFVNPDRVHCISRCSDAALSI